MVAQVNIILPPAPPVIVQNPVSQTVSLGASVSFAVAATGTGPFTYQWNKDGAPISGANAATFSISSVLVSDAAAYTVTVSNPGGNATSQPATLTVNTSGGSVVTRQITRSGTNFLVTVTVVPPVATPAYIVEEFVPTNFTVLNVSSGGSLTASSGQIEWGIFWDGLTRTVSYTLVPPPGFTGTTTINGAALFFGATATTGGDNQITMIPQNPTTLSITQWYGYAVISINGTVGSSYRLEASTNYNDRDLAIAGHFHFTQHSILGCGLGFTEHPESLLPDGLDPVTLAENEVGGIALKIVGKVLRYAKKSASESASERVMNE